MRNLVASLPVCALAFLCAIPAIASDCPGNPDALGVSRVLKVDTADGPRFGTLQYEKTLDLEPMEVVLTFDDGPHPRNTRRILSALDKECVKATFFPVGTMVEKYPETLLEIAEHGHSIGAHSWSHPNIQRLNKARATSQIERGFRIVNTVLDKQTAPFFRFPGLNDSDIMMEYATERGYAIFSTDVSSDDWLGIGPRSIVYRTMARLRRSKGGMVLLHDIKYSTARAIPALLKSLKKRGFRIVHIVPRQTYAEITTAKAYTGTLEEATLAGLSGPGEAVDAPEVVNR